MTFRKELRPDISKTSHQQMVGGRRCGVAPITKVIMEDLDAAGRCYRMAETELDLAERHLRESEEHLARQRKLVADLESGGFTQAADVARTTLSLFETSLAMHRARVASLRAKT
jgi:hypothetical protein